MYKGKKINIITNTDKESGSVFSSSEMGISWKWEPNFPKKWEIPNKREIRAFGDEVAN